MSYAQRKEFGTNRTVSIVVVALVHVLLGYVIITGCLLYTSPSPRDS